MVYLPKRIRNQHLVYDSDSLAYFNSAGIVDPKERVAWDAFVVGAKTTGIWSIIDRVYPFSPTSESAALYCAKSLTTMTNVGSEWTADGIETNDGKGRYLNTNYRPGSSFKSSNFSIFCGCSNVDVAIFGTNVFAGIFQSPTLAAWFELRATDDLAVNIGGSCGNTSIVSSSIYANPVPASYFLLNRVSDAKMDLYVDGELQGTTVAISLASLPALDFYLGARNQSGSPVQEYAGSFLFNFALFGGGLSDDQIASLVSMVEDYNNLVRP